MAQRVQILLVDDTDGGEADETVTFALDGVTYEIDLTTENADKLRGLLNPYTDSGRRTGGRASRGKPIVSGGAKGSDSAAIRAWAKEKGWEINDRGRVPLTVRKAYEKAQQTAATKAPVTAPDSAATPAPATAELPPSDSSHDESAPAKKPTARKVAAKKPAATTAAPESEPAKTPTARRTAAKKTAAATAK